MLAELLDTAANIALQLRIKRVQVNMPRFISLGEGRALDNGFGGKP
jgi:hypothetical protein